MCTQFTGTAERMVALLAIFLSFWLVCLKSILNQIHLGKGSSDASKIVQHWSQESAANGTGLLHFKSKFIVSFCTWQSKPASWVFLWCLYSACWCIKRECVMAGKTDSISHAQSFTNYLFYCEMKANPLHLFKKQLLQNVQWGLNTQVLSLLFLILCSLSLLAPNKSSYQNFLPQWFNFLPSVWILLKYFLTKKTFVPSLPLTLSAYLYTSMKKTSLFTYKAYRFASQWKCT